MTAVAAAPPNDFAWASATAVYVLKKPLKWFRSVDGGRRWEEISVPGSALFANPTSGSVYAAAGLTLFVSNDNAKTWRKLRWPPSPLVQIFVPVGLDLYAATSQGIFDYNQRTDSWTLIGDRNVVHSLAISAATPRHFYAAPVRGVITFTEGDRDWTLVNSGLPGAFASDVAVSPRLR